jgi:hypothetical protein
MSDAASAPNDGQPTVEHDVLAPDPALFPDPALAPVDGAAGPAVTTADRPELAVGAAFAGGFVLALLLKRLAR